MKCIQCGNEIGDDYRFCSFCGYENIPVAALQQSMPPMERAIQSQQPAPQKGGAVKWILAGLWLALAVIGWVVALILTTGSAPAQAEETRGAYREDSPVSLTEAAWYQYDPETGMLYCWHFFDNGTAEYSAAGEETWYQVTYSVEVDSGAVRIGPSDNQIVWVYDPLESCYWVYTNVCKTRVFPAIGIPSGSAAQYTYRVA